MTYHELISNQEQMEAYWRDFNIFWDSLVEGGTDPAIPDWVIRKDLDSKIYRWNAFLWDVMIDVYEAHERDE